MNPLNWKEYFLHSQTWLPAYHDIYLDRRSWCGSQTYRIHSSFPAMWKLMLVSPCCKLSKYWSRQKKLLEVSSGRGCTDVSFPDIFTVLAELLCRGRGQNMTSSSKPEQTWRSGYVLTSGVVDYELKAWALPLVSYNDSAACLGWKLISRLYQQHHRVSEWPIKNQRPAPLSYGCTSSIHTLTILKWIMIINFKLNFQNIGWRKCELTCVSIHYCEY